MTTYLIVDVYWYDSSRGELDEHHLTAAYIPPDPEAIRVVPEGVKITPNQQYIYREGEEVLQALKILDEGGVEGLESAVEALSEDTHEPLSPIMEFSLVETKIPVEDVYEIKPLERQFDSNDREYFNMHRRIVRDQYFGCGHGWIELDDTHDYVIGMSYSLNPDVIERDQGLGEMTSAAGVRIACDDVNQRKVIANFSCTQACLF